jgi:hypothetical protein
MLHREGHALQFPIRSGDPQCPSAVYHTECEFRGLLQILRIVAAEIEQHELPFAPEMRVSDRDSFS